MLLIALLSKESWSLTMLEWDKSEPYGLPATSTLPIPLVIGSPVAGFTVLSILESKDEPVVEVWPEKKLLMNSNMNNPPMS